MRTRIIRAYKRLIIGGVCVSDFCRRPLNLVALKLSPHQMGLEIMPQDFEEIRYFFYCTACSVVFIPVAS